jgi:putative hydrolase of the HAD superfamily
MIKGILFDLYGTLLKFGDMKKAWKEWLLVFYQSIQYFGLSMSLDEFSFKCDKFMDYDEPEIDDKSLSLYEKRIKRLIMELDLNIPDSEISIIADHTIQAWHKEVILDPEAPAVLKELFEKKLIGLVSNFDHPPHVHEILKKYNIAEYFNIVIISAEEKVKKPDPAIFNRVFTELELKIEEVVFIGDSQEDMDAAKNAGMRFIYVRRENERESINARDYRVNDDGNDHQMPQNVRSISSLKDVLEIIS